MVKVELINREIPAWELINCESAEMYLPKFTENFKFINNINYISTFIKRANWTLDEIFKEDLCLSRAWQKWLKSAPNRHL